MFNNINIRNCRKDIEKQTQALDIKEIISIFLDVCDASRGFSLFDCIGMQI